MKNIFPIGRFCGLLLISAFVFSACSLAGGDKPTSLVFELDDGSVPPQYFSVSRLELLPDYEARTLSAKYEQVYPNRTEETEWEDVSSTAELGEDYFIRFEELVVNVEEMNEYSVGAEEDFVGGGNFSVSLYQEDGLVSEVNTFWSDDQGEVADLKAFYSEVVNLLAGDVQV